MSLFVKRGKRPVNTRTATAASIGIDEVSSVPGQAVDAAAAAAATRDTTPRPAAPFPNGDTHAYDASTSPQVASKAAAHPHRQLGSLGSPATATSISSRKSLLSFGDEEESLDEERAQIEKQHTKERRVLAQQREVEERRQRARAKLLEREREAAGDDSQQDVPMSDVRPLKEGRESDFSRGISASEAARQAFSHIVIGDQDFAPSSSTASGSSGPNQPSYSKEALAALKQNAIHIATSTPSPHTLNSSDLSSSPNFAKPEDEDHIILSDSSPNSSEPRLNSSPSPIISSASSGGLTLEEQRRVRAANLTRARLRATAAHEADNEENFIPLAASSGPAGHSTGKNEMKASSASSNLTETVVLDKLYGEGDEDEENSTLLAEDEADDVIDVTYDENEQNQSLRFGSSAKQNKKERKEERKREIVASLNSVDEETIEIDAEGEEEVEELDIQGEEKDGRGTREPSEEMEDNSFEIQQLRRNVKLPPSIPTASTGSLASASLSSASVRGPLCGSSRSSVPAKDAFQVLKQRLKTMRENRAKNEKALLQVREELKEREKEMKGMDSKLEDAEESFLFYQDMRSKVLALLSCLNTKLPDISAAYEELLSLLAKRKENRMSMLMEDDNDRKEEAWGKQESENEPVQLDEFGRDLSYVREGGKGRRAKIREKVTEFLQQEQERRLIQFKKQQARASASPSSSSSSRSRPFPYPSSLFPPPHPDGWLSEDESYEHGSFLFSTFSTSLSSFQAEVNAIFADVDDAYSSLQSITRLFQHWKERYTQAYNDAYMALSMPVLTAPYVRMELMTTSLILPPLIHAQTASEHPDTDPSIPSKFYSTPFSFSLYSWYNDLFDYGVLPNTNSSNPKSSSSSSSSSSDSDADNLLIPTLIVKLFIPYFLSIMDSAWDVKSERQTNKIIEIFKAIVLHIDGTGVEGGEAGIERIKESIKARTEEELDRLLNQSPPSLPPALTTVQYNYCTRLFFFNLKFLLTLSSFTNTVLPHELVRPFANKAFNANIQPFFVYCLRRRKQIVGEELNELNEMMMTMSERLLGCLHVDWARLHVDSQLSRCYSALMGLEMARDSLKNKQSSALNPPLKGVAAQDPSINSAWEGIEAAFSSTLNRKSLK